MWFVIGSIIAVLLIVGAVWLRNRWILDSFNSYGVGGSMAGLYLYRRFGLWYIGTKNVDAAEERETSREELRQKVAEGFLKPI